MNNSDPVQGTCEACGCFYDPSNNSRFCCGACENIPGYGQMLKQLSESNHRDRQAVELVLFGHFVELFPNYAWTGPQTAADLMAAEIKTLRKELGSSKGGL